MKLFLQIGFYDETPNILDAFEVLKVFLPDDCSINLKRWQEGRRLRTAYKSCDKFVNSLKNIKRKKFNTIFIESVFQTHKINDYDVSIKSVEGYMEISPTNALWGKVGGYELENRNENLCRKTYLSLERRIKNDKIENYPNFLFLDISFSSALIEFPHNKDERLLKQISKLIIDAIPLSVFDLGFFACADMGLMYPRTVLHKRLEHFKNSYEKKFDGLHDILIRKRDLCSSFANRYGNDVNLFIEKQSLSKETYGLIYIIDKDHIDPKIIEESFVANELDEMYFPIIYQPPSHLDKFKPKIKEQLNNGIEISTIAKNYGTSVKILEYWINKNEL